MLLASHHPNLSKIEREKNMKTLVHSVVFLTIACAAAPTLATPCNGIQSQGRGTLVELYQDITGRFETREIQLCQNSRGQSYFQITYRPTDTESARIDLLKIQKIVTNKHSVEYRVQDNRPFHQENSGKRILRLISRDQTLVTDTARPSMTEWLALDTRSVQK